MTAHFTPPILHANTRDRRMATIIKPESLTQASGTAYRHVAYDLTDMAAEADDYLGGVRREAAKIVDQARQEAAAVRQRRRGRGQAGGRGSDRANSRRESREADEDADAGARGRRGADSPGEARLAAALGSQRREARGGDRRAAGARRANAAPGDRHRVDPRGARACHRERRDCDSTSSRRSPGARTTGLAARGGDAPDGDGPDRRRRFDRRRRLPRGHGVRPGRHAA